MSWLCSVCQKSCIRKDSMQRRVISKHRKTGLTPFQTVPMFSQKCQRFRFEHPFTSMISGMTGSRKTAWVRPSPGEDRLVLFTMAACLYTNVSGHATH